MTLSNTMCVAVDTLQTGIWPSLLLHTDAFRNTHSPATIRGLVFASIVVVNSSLGEIHVRRGQRACKQSLEAHARHRG